MALGTVKWFNDAKGYGFISRADDGKDVFVHYSSITGDGFRTLNQGQTVEYEEQQGPSSYSPQQANGLKNWIGSGSRGDGYRNLVGIASRFDPCYPTTDNECSHSVGQRCFAGDTECRHGSNSGFTCHCHYAYLYV